MIGIEVKSGATVTKSDFKGLERFKRQLGNQFRQGIVLYNGEKILPFGDKLIAAPINLLWEI